MTTDPNLRRSEMTIENRELAPGTKLVGTYKKTTFTCEVVSTPEGEVHFQLEDGRLFTSPSSAGKAVMNGVACNGWRFWSLAGTLRDAKPEKAKAEKNGRLVKQIKKLPNQKGVAASQTKWFCSACMESFLAETGTEPGACPKGHPREAEDELAPPA
jgi:Restriction Enzyme Adenine Methylase Associated